jgi:hypothetical protein
MKLCFNFIMKKIVSFYSILFFMTLGVTHALALPPCPSDPNATFDNCFGTYDWTAGDYKGDRYKGEWKKNKMHGQGMYIFANGDRYQGAWKDGKKHGQGTFIYEIGDKYIGEYKKGIMYGQGMYIWANGDKYQGAWKDGKKHGPGIYLYLADNEFKGDIYVGEYKFDLYNGQGTYIWKDGSKYTGNWLDNNQEGQGIYIYPDGRKEVGEFKNGLLNGFAIRYNADGSITQEGIFKDDEFLHAKTSEKKEPSKLDKYKSTCEELGFTPGTEKFGDCVIKLMD